MKIRATILILASAAMAARWANGQQPATVLGGDRPRISGPITLQKAVDTALQGNLDVQMSRAEAAAAGQETKATRAMTGPQISANTYLSAGNMANVLPSSPNVSPPGFLIAPNRAQADQNLTLMVPVYTGGRLGSLVRAAGQRENAAKAGIDVARADVALMVKDAYYRALLAGEMANVAQARLDAAQALVTITRAQFEAGKGIQASVARAEAEQADAQRMVTSAQNDRQKMILDLKRAMGVSLDSDISLADTLAYVANDSDPEAALRDASRMRPELIAARARAEAAGAQISAAKGARQPQVYGAAMGDVFAPNDMRRNTGGTVGVTVSIPLFDAGQRRAELGQAEAMRQRALADLKNTELRVATEVRQAELDVQTASQNYLTAQTAVHSAQAAFDVVLLRVQSGKAILVEQLDAQAALVQARTNLSQALYDHSIAIARLQRAIGRP